MYALSSTNPVRVPRTHFWSWPKNGQGRRLGLAVPTLGLGRFPGQELGPGEERALPRRVPGGGRWSVHARPPVRYLVSGKEQAVGVVPGSAAPNPRSGGGPVLPGTVAGRLRLRQHDGIASLVDNVSYRNPAPAVVPGAVGVFHLGAPGHMTADADGAAARRTSAARPTRRRTDIRDPAGKSTWRSQAGQIRLRKAREASPQVLQDGKSRSRVFQGHQKQETE